MSANDRSAFADEADRSGIDGFIASYTLEIELHCIRRSVAVGGIVGAGLGADGLQLRLVDALEQGGAQPSKGVDVPQSRVHAVGLFRRIPLSRVRRLGSSGEAVLEMEHSGNAWIEQFRISIRSDDDRRGPEVTVNDADSMECHRRGTESFQQLNASIDG